MKAVFKNNLVLLLWVCCLAFLFACSNETRDEVQSTSINTNPEEITAEDETNKIAENETEENKSKIDISGASLVQEGKLTVGMVIDYPPFEYYPAAGKAPIGVDVDIVTAVAKELGLELEIKDLPWDDNLFANMGKEYDLVCSAVTITDDRLQNMIFSNAYIDNYRSVVVRKDSNLTIMSFEDLAGLKVAVQKDTVSDELMLEIIEDKSLDIQLIENDVATDNFEQLKSGEVDAVVCDSTVAEGQTARNTDTFAEVYRDENNVEEFAIAISKDNAGLQKAINEALDELEAEGAITSIIKSWFAGN